VEISHLTRKNINISQCTDQCCGAGLGSARSEIRLRLRQLCSYVRQLIIFQTPVAFLIATRKFGHECRLKSNINYAAPQQESYRTIGKVDRNAIV
jgi:hypothetical protein